MARQPYREVTTPTTVPEGTAGAGTITTDTERDDVIQGIGTSFLTDFKYAAEAGNLWIFFETSEVVARVIGVTSDTTIILDRDVAGVAGENYQVVEGDLISYSISNTGAANGQINTGDGNAPIVPGQTINENSEAASVGYKQKDVIFVDGSGTSLNISENRG